MNGKSIYGVIGAALLSGAGGTVAFAQTKWPPPTTVQNPSSPPSTSSGSLTLNNWRSDWECDFGLDPTSPASVTLDYDPAGVLTLSGRTICYEVGPGGVPVPGRIAVFDIETFQVSGVQQAFGPLAGAGPFTQTVTYFADLAAGGAVTGLLKLNKELTDENFGLPTVKSQAPFNEPDYEEWVIKLGAKKGETQDLCTQSNPPGSEALEAGTPCPGPTFPEDTVLGYPLLVNQVLKFAEVRTFGQKPCETYPDALGAQAPDCRPVPRNQEIPVYTAVNRVLGTTYANNAAIKPLLVSPDYEWARPEGDVQQVVALIASSAGNQNTLGIYSDGTETDVTPPTSGSALYPAPFSAWPLPPVTAGGLPETFGWYLRSAGRTFYSDPTLNTGDTDKFDHLVAYDLTTACNKPVRVRIGDVEQWAVPAYLLAWEDLNNYGDADANDLIVAVMTLISYEKYGELVTAANNGSVCAGPTEGIRPQGVEGPAYIATRFCHSSDFDENAPVDCIRDSNGQPATGRVATLSVESTCPAGQGASGSILVNAMLGRAKIGWEGLNCRDGETSSGQEWARLGLGRFTEVGVGTPLRIRAIGGDLWSLLGQLTFGVRGPQDTAPLRSLVNCRPAGDVCESIEFALEDLDAEHLDRFAGVEVRFLVGLQGSRQIKVTAYDDGSSSDPSVPVFVETITATADPRSAYSRQLIDLGGKLATRVRFEAMPGGAFGLDGGVRFGTVAQ